MPSESARPIDPSPADFAGDSLARVGLRLFHATRPAFLTASALPVLAGSAWGLRQASGFDGWLFVLAVVATVCVHAGANVLNDVGDDTIGTDARNRDRIYPYTGGSRFIQTGIMAPAAMTRLAIGLFATAAPCGALLLLARGPLVLVFGLAGVVLGVLYSVGPLRLASAGLGEMAVAVAFGVLPVTGAAWLQGAPVDMAVLVFSLPISAWVAAILLINEVPDIAADRDSGKFTLPVRLGLSRTALLYGAIQLGALLAVLALAVTGALPPAAPLVPALLLLPARRAVAAIRSGITNRPAMTRAIQSTLFIHAAGSLWLAACVLYGFVRAG